MAEKIACEQCHRPATHKGTNSHGSNFLCGDCIASNEAAGDEIDAHEMKHFGGAYGLVERMHYEPLARNAGFIRADLVDDLVKALEEAREALSVFAAFSDKAERFVDHKAKFGGTAIFPVKDFRLSHFRRAVEVVALIDTLWPGDAP